jgi:hypothetical protein
MIPAASIMVDAEIMFSNKRLYNEGVCPHRIIRAFRLR